MPNAGLVGLERVGDLVVDQRRAEREIARGDRLGDRHHVRLHAPQPRARPGAGAAEAGHHLVRDQQDAVTVADLAHQRHEVVGRHDHPAGAEHRLHDEGGDRIRALEGDLVLDGGRAELARACAGSVSSNGLR